MENMTNEARSVAEIILDKKPNTKFLQNIVRAFKDSEDYKELQTAKRYYKNRNDIMDRKRTYIDRRGNKIELKNVSNDKLSHPFLKRLVRQKIAYALSKPVTFDTENKTLSDHMATIFEEKFMKLLKSLGEDAIVFKIGWLKLFYNEEGILSFRRLSPLNIRPFWADSEHTRLNALVYFYEEDVFAETLETRKYIEYYNPHGVWKFQETTEGLKLVDGYSEDGNGHFTIEKSALDENGEEVIGDDGQVVKEEHQAMWKQIPIIPFKYNPEEQSILDLVKTLIDSYDFVTSDCSNLVQDEPNKLKVVKGYEGTDKDEFVKNVAELRTLFVGSEGGLEVESNELDAAFPEAHLKRVREDIYEFGFGVDTRDSGIASKSGEALKFKYTDLELDCSYLINEFTESLNQVVDFVKADLAMKTGLNTLEEKVNIQFNTDMVINESAVISDVKNSLGVISTKTAIRNHPWVLNVDDELKEMKKEAEETVDDEPFVKQSEDDGESETLDE